jgi:hypothetical protein
LSVPVTFTCVDPDAVTVSTEELPEKIAEGLAAIVTVGRLVAPLTKTVAAADAEPLPPIATAVYVVVDRGETVCLPPVGGIT